MHKIKKVKYNSSEYKQVLQLRNKILRKPLGLDLFDEDLSSDKNQLIYGIFDSKKIIACLQAVPLENNTYKLRQMAVDKKYQGTGLGRELITFVEKELKNKQCREIVLHARKTAIGFYKKAGYKIVSKEFTEVGIPHFLMKKKL